MTSRTIICTKLAPKAVGPYSQAVRLGDFLFVSGQLGLLPESGEMVGGGVKAQAEQALSNISAIVSAAGISLENVVKTTVLLKDIGDFKTINEVYGEYFKTDPPARAAYAVSALPLGALIEIEAIAILA